jgi:uncharacterized membrane protein SpoIIM required for sporulation
MGSDAVALVMRSFKQMDLDALSTARSEDWQRLARLGRQHRHTGAEADELIERYQAGASDLSAIKTTVGQSIQGDALSLALSRARLRFTGASANALTRLPGFFAYQLPAALYRVRWITLAVAAGFFVIAALYGFWLSANPQLLLNFGSAADLKRYANQEFVGYYSAHPDASFASQVWTNNAWITAQCIAAGITLVWPIWTVFSNAQQLGVSAAAMHEYGRLDHFFLYTAPHGQLELYSIFLACAAGLLIGWSWIAPGGRTRLQALSEDGRAMFTIVVGVILSLAVSGVVEGFVTRQAWPWPIKIGIGTIALAAFLIYQWIVGRRAARAGQTGDLDEFEAGARQITAA